MVDSTSVTGDHDQCRRGSAQLRLADCGDVLVAAEVSAVLRVSVEAVYAAARRGDLPSLRFGRRVVFPKTALEALLAGSSPTRRRSR